MMQVNDPQAQTDDKKCGYCPNRVKTEGFHKLFFLISDDETYVSLCGLLLRSKIKIKVA